MMGWHPNQRPPPSPPPFSLALVTKCRWGSGFHHWAHVRLWVLTQARVQELELFVAGGLRCCHVERFKGVQKTFPSPVPQGA